MAVSDQLHALSTLPLGKQPWYPTEYEAEWDPQLVWTIQRREQKSLIPAWIQTLDCQAYSPVSILATLSHSLCFLYSKAEWWNNNFIL